MKEPKYARRRNRLSLVAAFALMIPSVSHAEIDANLTAKLDGVLSKYKDAGPTYVARVVEVSTGRELYLHDPDRAVAPASNAKLANDAAGLDRFGPDYIWRTYLALDGDDLWIIGTGDPACGDRRIEAAHGRKPMAILDDWADALAQRGVTRIKGNLLFDDGVFDDQRVGPSWPKSELTDWWSAPLTGLSLNGSCITVTAFADHHLEAIPETTGVTLINKTRNTGDREPLSIARQPDADVFTLTGLVTKTEEADFKPIIDPGVFFADALRTKLKAKGVTIEGKIARASRALAKAKWGPLKEADQRDERIVAVHETVMRDVLGRINKQSQNLFADALCKLQGRAWDLQHGKDEPGNWRAGGEAVHDFLKRLQIDDSKYVLVDGSGLSADDRVTARLLSELLIKMLKHKHGDEYRASLSVCGRDGTLDDRMMDIKGMVRGKSGTIDGVKALSGYLTTRGGELLVFSMIFNDSPEKLEKPCQHLLDDACRVMVDWTDAAASVRPTTKP